MAASSFELKVLSPSRQLMAIRATAITLPGTLGYMTILPDHAAMIAELDIGEVVVLSSDAGDNERFFIAGGYVEVENNQVNVLADVIEKAQEIDAGRAEQALKRASERLSQLETSLDLERANRSLKRAETRVFIAATMASTARLQG